MFGENATKWILLIILALTWGSSFILIKKGVEIYTPFQVGALRLTFAGLILAIWGFRNLSKIPKKKYPYILLAGVCGNFIPMFLFPLAEKEINSSMAGILNSLVPVFVVLFGFIIFQIKSTKIQIFGVVVGFIGAYILIYFAGEKPSNHSLIHSLWVVLATVLYAINGLVVKKHLADVPSFQLSSVLFVIFLFPSIIILWLSGFFQGSILEESYLNGMLYILILGVFGTAIAMILFYELIQRASAVFASSVTYLMPVVAIFWGLLDGEKFGVNHLIGGGLIFIGVYLIKEKSSIQ